VSTMNHPETEDLIFDLLEGEITAEGFAALEEELQRNPEARRLYLHNVRLQNGLALQAQGVSALQMQNVVPMEQVVERRKVRSLRRALFAAAALVLIGAIVGMFIAMPDRPAGRFVVSSDAEFIITHTSGAGEESPENGALAVGSRVKLLSGVFELKLDSGVRGIVRAPADFTLHSKMMVGLTNGIAWFEVSEEGKGFQVKTPEILVTDLGTEFGVLSTDSQPDEVHVFSGNVRVQNQSGLAGSQPLITQEACRGSANGGWEEIEFQAELFLTELKTDTLQRRYVHWSFDGEDPFRAEGTLSDAAEIAATPVQSDGRSEAGRFVPGKVGEALSFNGRGDHVGTNWKGLLGRTPRTLACWIKLHPNDIEGWAIIADWGDFMGGGGWRARVRAFPNPSDGAFLRVASGRNWCDSETNIADGKWHHVAICDELRLDASGYPSARLFVDGEEQALIWSTKGQRNVPSNTEVGDPFTIGTPHPEVNQQLHGAIDELYLFDQALTQEAIRKLMKLNQP